MRKLVFITGALSFSLSSVGYMFENLHIRGGELLILTSTIIFSLIFVPTAGVYYYKKGDRNKI